MKRAIAIVTMVAFVGMLSPAAEAQQQVYRFSVDIGGTEDISDPTSPGNNWMDCGDIYLEGASYMNPRPTLVKNDTQPALPYVGHPFNAAPQPAPALVGSGPVGTDPSDQYLDYFDLDAEDQLGFEVYPIHGQDPIAVGVNWGGVHLEPTQIDFSYEDDGPAGWYIQPGDVPTMVAPDHGSIAARDEIMIDRGPFGAWSPATVTGVRSEYDLGFGWGPPDELDDDDVDALDREEHRFFYWSPDHEASMGRDPGGIYVTDRWFPGQNYIKVIDDVLNLNIPADTDVDAWEFCAVDPETYIDLFGAVSGSPIVLIGLFSVDADDPDTLNVDESGGLDPRTIYASNLVGMSVGLATYAEDIDALTVPEPMTMGLLGIGGLVLLRRKSKIRCGGRGYGG